MHDNTVPRLSESSALLPASIRRAALFPAATLVLALVGLAACGGISRKPGEPPPPLPEGYRRSAAFHMLLDYERDGTGPAEIESTPWRASSLLGGERTYLLARYPVRRRDWLGRDAEGMRCFSIVTSWRPGEPEIRYEIGHQRRDPPSCMETVALEPFTELNEMRRRSEDCKARGQQPCILHSTFPGSEAELLRKIEQWNTPALPRSNPFR
ncbi:MAG: hypothetical protein DI532_14340 [Azospirillum brasilense]|nr:MAG: hypothetical protein DI532_14340 [Azospirillum brasilense]